ncbi:MAG: DNA cytosine methyltransferase [Planktothrix sp.]
MRYGSLFGGIRAADYAAKLAGYEIVFNSEIDRYCIELGQQRFGGTELGDIRNADFRPFEGLVDILCGGFPCQNISKAGKQEGIDGTSSRLWGHYYRAIQETRPGFALIENSDQITRKGLDQVLCDLAQIGYNAEWESLSAGEFGAIHQRERTWILAYPNSFGRPGILRLLKGSSHQEYVQPINKTMDGCGSYFEWFTERYGEPAVFGIYDGFTSKLHVPKRISAVGNSLYWPIPYCIFKTIDWAVHCTEQEWLTTNYHALINQTWKI